MILRLAFHYPHMRTHYPQRYPQRSAEEGERLRTITNCGERVKVNNGAGYKGIEAIKKPAHGGLFYYKLAPRPGLEPGTCGLTVRRSTD